MTETELLEWIRIYAKMAEQTEYSPSLRDSAKRKLNQLNETLTELRNKDTDTVGYRQLISYNNKKLKT